MMSRIATITGKPMVLHDDDIDTDRIIPARFLKGVTFDKLGTHVFEDDRKAAREKGEMHPFDDPQNKGAAILFAGENFGSGSSREHAVHALRKWDTEAGNPGIQAIVALGKYSEIFFGNALANGMPCVVVSKNDWRLLVDASEESDVTLDLKKMEVRSGEITKPATFQRHGAQEQFLKGTWDSLTVLQESQENVEKVISRLPYYKA